MYKPEIITCYGALSRDIRGRQDVTRYSQDKIVTAIHDYILIFPPQHIGMIINNVYRIQYYYADTSVVHGTAGYLRGKLLDSNYDMRDIYYKCESITEFTSEEKMKLFEAILSGEN